MSNTKIGRPFKDAPINTWVINSVRENEPIKITQLKARNPNAEPMKLHFDPKRLQILDVPVGEEVKPLIIMDYDGLIKE